jgi:hypothetical protein
MAQSENALGFIESAVLPERERGSVEGLERGSVEGLEGGKPEGGGPAAGLNLDKLPAGVVSGNTLIDYSAAASPQIRSGVSLAMLFAGRAATAAMGDGADEDDWLAAYKTNLMKLGFGVAGSALQRSRFKKEGVFVHQAIIPFLTIALGGAALGPVILAALGNLQEMDKGQPWITLFDRETRKFDSRELHFAAVSADASTTQIRHVVARLGFAQDTTSILFFKVTRASADFESATTTMSADNGLLAVIEPGLRKRLEGDALGFIAETTLAPRG